MLGRLVVPNRGARCPPDGACHFLPWRWQAQSKKDFGDSIQ